MTSAIKSHIKGKDYDTYFQALSLAIGACDFQVRGHSGTSDFEQGFDLFLFTLYYWKHFFQFHAIAVYIMKLFLFFKL